MYKLNKGCFCLKLSTFGRYFAIIVILITVKLLIDNLIDLETFLSSDDMNDRYPDPVLLISIIWGILQLGCVICLSVGIFKSNYRWFLPWLYLHLTILIACMVLIFYIVLQLASAYSDALFKVFLFCIFNNFFLTYCFICIHSFYEELKWAAENPEYLNDLIIPVVPVPNKVEIYCGDDNDRDCV